MKLSNYFYHDSRVMLLAISLILVSGLSSIFILPRMEDPTLVPRGAFVNTIFPGANPSRVESLVSEKIEDSLSEIDEIKEIRSTSRESISTIAIELRDDVLDSDPVWSKIRNRITDVESSLPEGCLRPDFDEMDFKAFAMLVALKWKQEGPVSYAVLRRQAKQLEDRLRRVNGTEKVENRGAPSEEILVKLYPERVTALNLTVDDIARVLASSDAKVSAGQIRSSTDEMLVEVSGELDCVQRIESLPIPVPASAQASNQEGGFIRLSNLATVQRAIADPPESLAIIDGQPAIVLGIFVREDRRIDRWAGDAAAAVNKFSSNLPRGIELEILFNQNEYVTQRLSTLMLNLLAGGTAVFLVIFFLMGWRSAVVVSIALPLAAMMVLFGMRLLGIPIHQMSVTGLIIALGLLIDNAIVIVDETSGHLRSGLPPSTAVSKSVLHLFWPLFGSTVTTALAFAPIALMPGPAGEFVGAIAMTVIMAIFSSFFLAMTIIPAIAARIGSSNDSNTNTQRSWWKTGFSSKTISGIYRSFLDFIFARPLIGIAISFILPIMGFVAASQLTEQFFPPSDRDQVHIELELSPTSSLARTLKTTEAVRTALLAEDEVTRVDWFVGESAPAFYYNLIPRRRNISQYAQALVQLNTAENQAQLIHRLQAKLDREFSHARILVRQLEQGPPFDAPVEIRLYGPDLDRLQQLGTDVRRVLVDTPGVIHTRSDLDEVLPKLTFSIKDEQAQAAGVRLTEIANQLNANTNGKIGGSVIEATEELPVRVRLDNESRSGLAGISNLNIVNPNIRTTNAVTNRFNAGRYQGIPISAIADVGLDSEYGSITHLAGTRLHEIQVYIPAGMLPATVLSAFQQRLADSGFELPSGYSLTYGGEAAKRDEAIGNLMANVGILLVLMIATLVMSFASFRMATIVGIVGGLSVGLGMGALWVFGYPFGFTAIVGTMGLMGVAINDTIVVLAAISGNENASAGDRQAMRDVVNQSTRHIISTSLTTMAGFTPLIVGGGGFWPPLAVAIAGGVGGATILALIFAPSAYLLLMCRKQKPLAVA